MILLCRHFGAMIARLFCETVCVSGSQGSVLAWEKTMPRWLKIAFVILAFLLLAAIPLAKQFESRSLGLFRLPNESAKRPQPHNKNV
jgi:hypothetical protein